MTMPSGVRSYRTLLSILVVASTATTTRSFSAPSWDQLQSKSSPLYGPLQIPPPIYIDELPDDVREAKSHLPILYRDKDCICIASEIVWLALECKNVEYLTVLVSKRDKHDDDNDGLPRILWPDDDDDDDVDSHNNSNNGPISTSDPIQLLEQIQSRYPSRPPQFYPKISISVDASRSNILRLPGVMPRYSDPALASLSPFLFRCDGTAVPKPSHCVSIEEFEEMMEEYDAGPYLCGAELTAADMVWMPHLERYAVQLPLLYPKRDVLNPRSSACELVAEWCDVMERTVAPYACRVMGDARHWRRCLEEGIDVHNARAQEGERVEALPTMPKRKRWWLKSNPNARRLWKEYARHVNGGRPWLGETPEQEAALFMWRKRDEITSKFVDASAAKVSTEEADEALRHVIRVLIGWNRDDDGDDGDREETRIFSPHALQLLEFVVDSIEIPRDMGMVPALALGELLTEMEALVAQEMNVG
ncbi:hypothetical protein ACHAWX_001834 [Stephanocyclus meneghinianus]